MGVIRRARKQTSRQSRPWGAPTKTDSRRSRLKPLLQGGSARTLELWEAVELALQDVQAAGQFAVADSVFVVQLL